MKKLLLIMSCVGVLAFSACGKQESEPQKTEVTQDQESNGSESKDAEDKAKFSELALSAWNGTWNSMATLLDDPAFESAYPEFAKSSKESTTPEKVKADYEDTYKTDFGTIVFNNDEVSFYKDAAKEDGTLIGDPIYKGTYASEGMEVVEDSYAWYKFKSSEEGPYQYLLLLPPESAEEDGFAHWHYRYGSEGFDKLLAQDSWWATSILPETKAQVVVDSFSGN